jgi:hypothetical protein
METNDQGLSRDRPTTVKGADVLRHVKGADVLRFGVIDDHGHRMSGDVALDMVERWLCGGPREAEFFWNFRNTNARYSFDRPEAQKVVAVIDNVWVSAREGLDGVVVGKVLADYSVVDTPEGRVLDAMLEAGMPMEPAVGGTATFSQQLSAMRETGDSLLVSARHPEEIVSFRVERVTFVFSWEKP